MVRGGCGVLVAAVLLCLGARGFAADGARIYADRCGGCHGDEGRGDGPAAAAVEPKPRNFRSADFWHDKTDAGLRAVVMHGKPGTMMPPFAGVLSDQEIAAVVAFIRHFDPASGAAQPATMGKRQ
jgi:mono/diheme cytochrome c family protein